MAIFGAHVEGEAMEEISQDLDEMEAGNARNLFFLVSDPSDIFLVLKKTYYFLHSIED
jgi:hypothetical protein